MASLTLVDGGPPMAAPPGLTPDLVPSVFAGRIGRLDRVWNSVEEYRDDVCSDVAPLLDRDDELLLENLAHDLDDTGRVRLDGQALIEDATYIYFGENPWQRLVMPVSFLQAQWGVGADSPPAYGPAQLAEIERAGISSIEISGVDHAGTVMSPRGAAAVAEVLRDHLTSTRP